MTEARLKAKQHEKLKELHLKVKEVLEHEPLDSEDDVESEVWSLINELNDNLDDIWREQK